jgi:hypothetical protein
VEGGPTVAGAAPKAPEKKPEPNINMNISAVLDDELQKNFFILLEEDKTIKPVVPVAPNTTGNKP